METQTVPGNQVQERTCPHCGLSGFASMQSLSKHAARCPSSGGSNPPERARETHPPNADNPTTPASKEAQAAEPAAPAVVEIACPDCGSRVTSDGRTLVKRSPYQTKLLRSEVGLSNAEAEGEKLQEEIKALEKKREEDGKTPEQRFIEEKETLCEKIRKLGATPEECRPRFRFTSSKLDLLREENEKLKRQLEKLEAKNGQKKAAPEEAPKEAPERVSRIFHRQPRI